MTSGPRSPRRSVADSCPFEGEVPCPGAAEPVAAGLSGDCDGPADRDGEADDDGEADAVEADAEGDGPVLDGATATADRDDRGADADAEAEPDVVDGSGTLALTSSGSAPSRAGASYEKSPLTNPAATTATTTPAAASSAVRRPRRPGCSSDAARRSPSVSPPTPAPTPAAAPAPAPPTPAPGAGCPVLDPEERHRVVGRHPPQPHRPSRSVLAPASTPAASTPAAALGVGVGGLTPRTPHSQLHVRTYPQRIEVLRRGRLSRTGVPQGVGRA